MVLYMIFQSVSNWYALFWFWWEFFSEHSHHLLLQIGSTNIFLSSAMTTVCFFMQLQQLLWYWNINIFNCCYCYDTFEYKNNVYVSNESCFIELIDTKMTFSFATVLNILDTGYSPVLQCAASYCSQALYCVVWVPCVSCISCMLTDDLLI